MSRRVTSEERQRELIAVALRQYVELGIAATTRTTLAAELGVDRVIVHRLYPDLDDLFTDVIDHVGAVGARAIDDAAAAADALGDDDELWSELLGMLLRAARAHPYEWQFLFLTPTGAGTAERLVAFQSLMADRIIGELTARVDAGASAERRQEIGWAARFLYEGLFGSIAAHLAHGDEGDDGRFVAHLSVLIDDLLATEVDQG